MTRLRFQRPPSAMLEYSTRRQIQKVLLYLWKDEKKHWEESGRPNKHIFVTMQQLNINLHLGIDEEKGA